MTRAKLLSALKSKTNLPIEVLKQIVSLDRPDYNEDSELPFSKNQLQRYLNIANRMSDWNV